MEYVDLIGFAPDADPTTPGVMADCQALIPTARGFRALPGLTQVEVSSCSVFPDATIVGAGVGVWAGRNVFLAATASKVFALQYPAPTAGGVNWANWVNVSQAGDASISGARVFEQFGDYIISAQGDGAQLAARTLQAYSLAAGTNTAFAQIASAPAAPIVVAASRFVMALGFSVDGSSNWDGWKSSKRDDHTDWSLNAATGCAQGRLVETPGPIVAGIATDNDILAWKYEGMFQARYVGAPEVWVWDRLPFKVGCMGARAVCRDDEGNVWFLDASNLYRYDGAACTPLMTGRLQRWYATTIVSYLSARDGAVLTWDSVHNLLWIEARNSNDSTVKLLAFHPATNRWTKTETTLGAISGSVQIPIDWANVGLQGSDFVPNKRGLGVFNSVRSLRSVAGTYSAVTGIGAPAFTTGDFGDVSADVELRAARLKFVTAPTTSTCTPMHRQNLDATLTTAAAIGRYTGTGRYDLYQIDRWHRLAFNFDSHCEFSGYAIDGQAVDEQ